MEREMVLIKKKYFKKQFFFIIIFIEYNFRISRHLKNDFFNKTNFIKVLK